jgi:hypothetical protein
LPLLLADYEGFGAGTATTNMVRPAGLHENEDDEAGVIKDAHRCSLLEKQKNIGKYGIDLFYARILYPINGIIDFVINPDQTNKEDLVQVLEWAVLVTSAAPFYLLPFYK